jgi:hypothetical protein
MLRMSSYENKIAGLKENEVQVKWLQSSAYTNPIAHERDRMWDAINYDSGIVAVPKPWARQKGLTLGVDFPWDTSKTLCFVNAFHSLHYVVSLLESDAWIRLLTTRLEVYLPLTDGVSGGNLTILWRESYHTLPGPDSC